MTFLACVIDRWTVPSRRSTSHLCERTAPHGAIIDGHWGNFSPCLWCLPVHAFATFLISAADLLNDRVFPVCDSHEVTLLRVLTGRGSEYSGNPERHEYELYLAIEDIHTRAPRPRTLRGFHKTVLNEFYRVAFRKKVCCSIERVAC